LFAWAQAGGVNRAVARAAMCEVQEGKNEWPTRQEAPNSQGIDCLYFCRNLIRYSLNHAPVVSYQYLDGADLSSLAQPQMAKVSHQLASEGFCTVHKSRMNALAWEDPLSLGQLKFHLVDPG